MPDTEQNSNVMLHKHVSWWRGGAWLLTQLMNPRGVPASLVDVGLRQQGTKIEGYRGKLRVWWF